MKKIFTVVLFFTLFLFTSCLTDVFSKNKDDYKDNDQATTEVASPETPEIPKSASDSNQELSIKSLRESLLSDAENKNTTLQDLINEEPEDFEEPLVRDLEYSPSSANTPKESAATETASTPSATPSTQMATASSGTTPAAKTGSTSTASAAKTSGATTPAAKTAAASTTAAQIASTPATSAASTAKKTDTKTTATATQSAVNNNSDYSETSLATSSGTPSEDEVEAVTPKTTEAPKTSAGTKTENKPAVIPSKPAATPAATKTEEKPKASSSNYPEAKTEVKAPETEKSEAAKENKTEIKTSRKITLNKGETLVVEYPGKGWIYLGSDHEYNNLESKGRKANTDATTYTLVAKEPGTQIQHFYKTDSITGNYIDDYIEVTVNDIKGSPFTEVHAPDYKEIVPEKPSKPAVASDKIAKPDVKIPDLAKPKTGERQSFEYTPEDSAEEIADYVEAEITDSKPSIIEDYDGDDLLKQAQALYDEKKYEDSLKVINVFLDFAISKRDKGLYLKGQILEADSTIKNIKEAISCYNNIIENYPASDLWDKANKRIIYLKRFYLEAR